MRLLRDAVGLAGVLATGWWAFTFSGPYRFIADSQLDWFGVYYPSVTNVLTLVVAITPALLMSIVLRVQERAAHPEEDRRIWLYERYGQFAIIAIVAAGFAAQGAYKLGDAATMGPRTAVDLAAWEAGEVPVSRWVEVKAVPAWDVAVTVVDGSLETTILPLLSPDWTPEGRVVLYATMTKEQQYRLYNSRSDERRTVSGTVARVGLQGSEGAWMADSQARPLDPHHRVLEYENTPDATKQSGILWLGGGSVVVLMMVFAI